MLTLNRVMLLPLFTSMAWFVLANGLTSSTAQAQQKICVNGVCYTVGEPTPAPAMPVVATTVQATRSIVEFALPPYRATAPTFAATASCGCVNCQCAQRASVGYGTRTYTFTGPTRRVFFWRR